MRWCKGASTAARRAGSRSGSWIHGSLQLTRAVEEARRRALIDAASHMQVVACVGEHVDQEGSAEGRASRLGQTRPDARRRAQDLRARPAGAPCVEPAAGRVPSRTRWGRAPRPTRRLDAARRYAARHGLRIARGDQPPALRGSHGADLPLEPPTGRPTMAPAARRRVDLTEHCSGERRERRRWQRPAPSHASATSTAAPARRAVT